jgi:hypothetical protein
MITMTSIIQPPIISFYMQKSRIMFKMCFFILKFPGIHIYIIGFLNLYYFCNNHDYIYVNYKYSLICEILLKLNIETYIIHIRRSCCTWMNILLIHIFVHFICCLWVKSKDISTYNVV